MTILLFIFYLCITIQIGYYIFLFSRLVFKKKTLISYSSSTPISVVICAKNEINNLQQNLTKILTQDYKYYEVIVVNDCSTDESASFLEQLSLQYNRLKVVTLKHKKYKGKKEALTAGINSANNELIVVTDADCKPVSSKWLSVFSSNYSQQHKPIILGYAPYKKTKGILNQIIRYETTLTAIQYLSYTLSGRPYMGVGRNMVYQKRDFLATGLNHHLEIPSGDDDLLIRDIANKHNTTVEINPDSFMYSAAESSFKTWFNQKLRHYSTGKHYKNKTKLQLGLFLGSKLLVYALTAFLIIFSIYNARVRYIFTIYLIVMMITMLPISKKLKVLDQWLFIPILDIVYCITTITIGIKSTLQKETQW